MDDKKKWVVKEDARLRKRVEEEAEREHLILSDPSDSNPDIVIARLQQVQLVANEFDAKSKELAAAYEVSLDPFSPLVYRLLSEYSNEYDKYRLDEIVVAAIAPSVTIILFSFWSTLLIRIPGATNGVPMGSITGPHFHYFHFSELATCAPC